jgi:hypothetical protein
MKTLLNTAYWPNLHYFYYLLNSDSTLIEQFDTYQKQSFRNRTQILSANGTLDLTIPIAKKGGKELTKEVRINYSENWQINHWRAITSAYKNSPYFEFFEHEIEVFYSKKHELLIDYNTKQLECVIKLLKLSKKISFTTSFEKQPNGFNDLRDVIHPKKDFTNDGEAKEILLQPYYQTFGAKFGFIPNLNILDLIFNIGLGVGNYYRLDSSKK